MVSEEAMHRQFDLQKLAVNGLSLRAAVEGDGPLVIMMHGWPELWYSWRHQIKPIVQAGYRVVAADVSPEMMARAAPRTGGRILGFVQADCEALPFRSAAVDAVVSMRFLFHVPLGESRTAMLREMV